MYTSKTSLRSSYKMIRSQLSMERREEAKKASTDYLLHALRNFSCILSFASTSDEIDIWPINSYLMQRKILCLPKVQSESLSVYKVEALESLIPSSWGIREPSPATCCAVPLKDVQAALVPGLCFDKRGARIGYGKGYYDKLLAMMRKSRPSVVIYGVGFKEQLTTSDIPQEEYDQKVDEVLLF